MLNEFTPSCDHTQEKPTGRSSGADEGREEEDHQGDGISELEAERQARKNKTSKVVRKPTPPCGLDLSCQSWCRVGEPSRAGWRTTLPSASTLHLFPLHSHCFRVGLSCVSLTFYLTTSSCFPHTSSLSIPWPPTPSVFPLPISYSSHSALLSLFIIPPPAIATSLGIAFLKFYQSS